MFYSQRWQLSQGNNEIDPKTHSCYDLVEVGTFKIIQLDNFENWGSG